MKGYRKKLGEWGEQLATQYFLDRNYVSLEHNWQKRQGEIDLIFKYKQDIVFVEVKTRTSPMFGGGEEAVDHRKKEKISFVINKYLGAHRQYQKYFPRFDILVVEIFSLTPKFIHYENVTL